MDTTRRFPTLTVAATSLGFAVVQLDVTIVNVALPRIGAELGASVASLQWIVDAYTLTFAVLLLGAGALSDHLGARAAYVVGFALLALASSMCGLAPDACSLIAARALQGVGAALLVPSSLALLNAACEPDPSWRARAVGLWTAAGGASIAAGPLVGATLLGAFGWRSIFLVNIPVCALAALAAMRWLREQPPGRAAHAFDVRGQILAVATVTALVATIIAASKGPIDPARIAAGFAVAVLGATLFCMVEARAPAPMLPPAFFRRPGFGCAMLFGVIVNLTYYGIVFVLTLYLQQARRYAALDAALACLPLTATFIVSNVASGSVIARLGTRLPMIAGALIGATGFALLARLDAASPFTAMLAPFVLIPFGMGLAVPAMTTLTLSSVERRSSGTATGALNAARQVGGALGVAVFGGLVADDRIVAGLREAACIAAALMIGAAIVAASRRPAARSDGGARDAAAPSRVLQQCTRIR
jgi:DHA2 family methylenomycin A resistance protein-like MFS transporter